MFWYFAWVFLTFGAPWGFHATSTAFVRAICFIVGEVWFQSLECLRCCLRKVQCSRGFVAGDVFGFGDLRQLGLVWNQLIDIGLWFGNSYYIWRSNWELFGLLRRGVFLNFNLFWTETFVLLLQLLHEVPGLIISPKAASITTRCPISNLRLATEAPGGLWCSQTLAEAGVPRRKLLLMGVSSVGQAFLRQDRYQHPFDFIFDFWTRSDQLFGLTTVRRGTESMVLDFWHGSRSFLLYIHIGLLLLISWLGLSIGTQLLLRSASIQRRQGVPAKSRGLGALDLIFDFLLYLLPDFCD